MPIHRSRPVAAGVALAAVALAAVATPGWLTVGPSAAAEVVPDRVHIPWLWQATVGQLPPGPASVLFFTDRTRYAESTGVVVGGDGSYRLLPMTVGEGHGLLSPDGRWYLRPGTGGLVDLRTGDERHGHRAGIAPLAWSPDGTRVVGSRSNDDAVITYGPDNQPLNDPARPDDLLSVDPWTGHERILPVGVFASHSAAAWSPGGTGLAVAGPVDVEAQLAERERLVVTDPSGAVRWQVELGDRRRLAGPAAWSPDGRRIALLVHDGCVTSCADVAELLRRSWRIESLDAATGRPVGDPVPVAGSPSAVVGWLGADPVVERQTRTPDHQRRRTALAVVTGGGAERILVDSADGVGGLHVPRHLMVRGAFGGPAPHPSPFAAPPWLYGAVGGAVALAGAALTRRLRRDAVSRLTAGGDSPVRV